MGPSGLSAIRCSGKTYASLFAISTTALASADSGTIYVTYDGQGIPHYASQPYDRSYTPVAPATGVQDKGAPTPQVTSSRLYGARQRLEPTIAANAKKFDVDPALLVALIHTESAFDTAARSSKGAVGAMQLMPATAARYGSSAAANPAINIAIGTRHLKSLLTRFNGNLPLALAAYNSGEGTVTRYGNRIPPYRETMLYVPTVLSRYNTYRRTQDASGIFADGILETSCQEDTAQQSIRHADQDREHTPAHSGS